MGLDWWLERLELESKLGEVICAWCCWRGEWDEEMLRDFPPDVDAFGGAEVIVVNILSSELPQTWVVEQCRGKKRICRAVDGELTESWVADFRIPSHPQPSVARAT